MKFWKENDLKGNVKGIKAIVSDNILNYNGVCVYENPGNLEAFIVPSNGICFMDENERKKPFYVSIDGTIIRNKVDTVYFVTSYDYADDIDEITIIGGDITDKECEDSSTIIFEKGLKDPVYIDMKETDGYISVTIDTCKLPEELTKCIISNDQEENYG